MRKTTSNDSVEFFVPGIPRPFARPRPGRNGGWFNPKLYAAWKINVAMRARKVKAAMRSSIPPPYQVTAVFYLPKPKKPRSDAPAWPKRSDLDNLLKGICDALQDAGIIGDDRDVVSHGPEPPRKTFAITECGAKIRLSHFFPEHV